MLYIFQIEDEDLEDNNLIPENILIYNDNNMSILYNGNRYSKKVIKQ